MAFTLDDHAPEEYNMLTARKRVVALSVERSCQQRGVRDPEGNFCLPPAVADLGG